MMFGRALPFFLWLAAISLAIFVFLAALLGTFHDDAFYHFAYGRNGAYEQLDEEMVWWATENFQSFVIGREPLRFFDDDQASHLAEVKDVYVRGLRVAFASVLVFFGAFIWLSFLPQRKQLLARVFARSALVLLAALLVFVVLGANWEWFFTSFHQLFFYGQWRFSAASLMLRLWGGSFFMLAALYVSVKLLVAGCLLFVGSRLMEKLS